MDAEEAKRLGYKLTPGGYQWSPGPRQPVDRATWKPCEACGKRIPVVEDWGPLAAESIQIKPLGTWTYVCPFCRHCHVGTPDDSSDRKAQVACHECRTPLGPAYQCPKCSFPRGWMTVQCPFCDNRQPVDAPHWYCCCDVFTLDCVKCESRFVSLCIC